MEVKPDRGIVAEMIYTPLAQACKAMAMDADGLLRLCRRQYKHEGNCASDHPYLEWDRKKAP